MSTRRAQACSSPAKWSAAPTAPTGCRATRSPKRSCSAAAPDEAPAQARANDSAPQTLRPQDTAAAIRSACAPTRAAHGRANTAAMIARLQATMADDVGPIRTGAKLARALDDIAALAAEARRAAARPAPAPSISSGSTGSICATCCSSRAPSPQAALERTESRGAHQREDFPQHAAAMAAASTRAVRRMASGALQISRRTPAAAKALAS